MEVLKKSCRRHSLTFTNRLSITTIGTLIIDGVVIRDDRNPVVSLYEKKRKEKRKGGRRKKDEKGKQNEKKHGKNIVKEKEAENLNNKKEDEDKAEAMEMYNAEIKNFNTEITRLQKQAIQVDNAIKGIIGKIDLISKHKSRNLGQTTSKCADQSEYESMSNSNKRHVKTNTEDELRYKRQKWDGSMGEKTKFILERKLKKQVRDRIQIKMSELRDRLGELKQQKYALNNVCYRPCISRFNLLSLQRNKHVERAKPTSTLKNLQMRSEDDADAIDTSRIPVISDDDLFISGTDYDIVATIYVKGQYPSL
ncbi:hypothetical protein EC973_004860 [Apophysomyces ossiformis]|uniref:Uncharacterized protein n=1 Tax=Apophysomyces ossiformis TaxID=679940 RepID=A0A8H7EKC4_9FUNG|nr:hypothetical protein EC973_004860 [Apophysomyces ossiformis]